MERSPSLFTTWGPLKLNRVEFVDDVEACTP